MKPNIENELGNLATEALNSHRQAYGKEDFENDIGYPVRRWIDKDRNLCIEYSSGTWFHYKPTTFGFEWW